VAAVIGGVAVPAAAMAQSDGGARPSPAGQAAAAGAGAAAAAARPAAALWAGPPGRDAEGEMPGRVHGRYERWRAADLVSARTDCLGVEAFIVRATDGRCTSHPGRAVKRVEGNGRRSGAAEGDQVGRSYGVSARAPSRAWWSARITIERDNATSHALALLQRHLAEAHTGWYRCPR